MALKAILLAPDPMGKRDHRAKARKIPATGEAKKTSLLLLVGVVNSFTKSLAASAIGCKIPKIETLFGPFRYCMSPRTFRSNKVIKATLINIKTITIKCIKLR